MSSQHNSPDSEHNMTTFGIRKELIQSRNDILTGKGKRGAWNKYGGLERFDMRIMMEWDRVGCVQHWISLSV
jgi:hypothetical protein